MSCCSYTTPVSYSRNGSDWHGKYRTSQSSRPDKRTEVGRLQTFREWPLMSPQPLALSRVGFFYSGEGVTVTCCDCYMSKKSWETDEIPILAHYKLNRRCKYVQKFREALSSLSPGKQEDNQLENRKLSFVRNCLSVKHDVNYLANAGFCHSGDRIFCVSCDVDVTDMKQCDIPLCEHYVRSPECSYVRHMINLIPNDLHNFNVVSEESCNSKRIESTEILNPPKIDVVILESPKIEAVVEMGYPKFLVEQIVIEHFLLTGQDFSSAEDLCRVVMDAEINTCDIEGAEIVAMADENTVGLNQEKLDSVNVIDEPTFFSLPNSERTSLMADRNEQVKNLHVSEKPTHFCMPNSERTSSVVDEQVLCKICLDDKLEITFQPCGHFATCLKCSEKLTECPICRSSITQSIRTYLS